MIDLRALQRAVEDGQLSPGDRADVLELRPELRGVIEWWEAKVHPDWAVNPRH